MVPDERQLHSSPEPVRVMATGLIPLLHISPDALLVIDQAGTITAVNEQTEALFGFAHSELPGQQIEILLPERFRDAHIAHREYFFSAPRARHMGTGLQLSGKRRDGSEFPVDISLRPLLVDDTLHVIGTVRDMTEQKRMEDARHRLASIVECSGVAILSKTLEGVITSWNRSAENLFGYRAEEAIGQSVSLIFPLDHEQELREILAQIAQGKTLKVYETTRVRKDGTSIQVSITISPILDHKGHIIGASTIAHDNTEHKRLMQDLIDVNAALVEANKARDQFLATISHELRTPLASIIGFSEMLLEDITKAGLSSLQDNQQRILKNAQHLLDLINDVLDLSKIEAGRMDVTFMQVNVRKLLTSVVEETHSIALAQHLALRVEVEEGLDTLETNELKLHQILLNLVSNALKFTKQGEVTLSARRMESPDQEGERVALAVTDTGIDIPTDIQERIFEEFYQADGSYTRKFGGTGLGLAIVRQLTTLLGGTIQLKSSPGQGSTFTVLLPIKAVHQPGEQASSSPRLHAALPPKSLAASANREAKDGQNNVVLAVDDNPDVIDLIKTAFKNTPYKVVGLTDPSKAMESIKKLRPCAITLDVMMPKLNGWQILHRLKDNPAAASIPVIMLSVLSEPSTGYVLGADDFLIKPFKRDALVSTLNRLMASRESPSQVTNQA